MGLKNTRRKQRTMCRAGERSPTDRLAGESKMAVPWRHGEAAGAARRTRGLIESAALGMQQRLDPTSASSASQSSFASALPLPCVCWQERRLRESRVFERDEGHRFFIAKGWARIIPSIGVFAKAWQGRFAEGTALQAGLCCADKSVSKSNFKSLFKNR
jgi:hypothetical protein